MKIRKLIASIFFLLFVNFCFCQTASDTIIDKINYNWVQYDLNRTPYEVGQDFSNGIKNGKWIYRDQQGRITSIVHFKNDTLMGQVEEYYYDNDPVVLKYYGVFLNGYRVGKWVSAKKANRHRKWAFYTASVVLEFDLTGRTISRTVLYENGKPNVIAFYNLQGEECFWQFFDKKGKLKRETNIYPYVIQNL